MAAVAAAAVAVAVAVGGDGADDRGDPVGVVLQPVAQPRHLPRVHMDLRTLQLHLVSKIMW